MRLYIVTFQVADGTYYTEPYLARDFEDAEKQCRDDNPPDIKIIVTARIPFYMIERAYLITRRHEFHPH